MICDFEKGLHKAISNVFPECKVAELLAKLVEYEFLIRTDTIKRFSSRQRRSNSQTGLPMLSFDRLKSLINEAKLHLSHYAESISNLLESKQIFMNSIESFTLELESLFFL